MRQEIIEEGIIQGYRSIIKTRYDYNNLSSNYELPVEFDKNKIDEIREFFLESLYPDIAQRRTLNEAFDTLDEYIKKPQKLLNILITSSRLIFKYGRYLPKILGTGIKALKSFRAANRFENDLVRAAQEADRLPPYSEDDIYFFISTLSKDKVDAFVDDSKTLFEVLHDRKLVTKILDIANELVRKMKEKPSLYSKAETDGIELGLQIIEKGNALFEELSKDGRKAVIDLTVEIEQNALDEIFSK